MELQNKQEHIECRYCATERNALLRQWCFAAGGGTLPNDLNRKNGILLYVQAGAVEIDDGNSRKETVSAQRLFFLPQNCIFSAKALTDIVLWTCVTPLNIPMCNRYEFVDLQNDMREKSESQSAESTQIDANLRVRDFFSNLQETFADGLNCIHYHEMKREELFLLLRAYYTKEELFRLYRPMIETDYDFRRFVLRHYKEVEDVDEFASLANMSVRSFQRRFKAEFSCSAKDWMLERRAETILGELHSTEKDLATIAFEHGFSSMSYFSSFCKHHFGSSPSEIRKMRETTSGQLRPCTSPPPQSRRRHSKK